jgi:hypothetical protein
MLSTLTLSGTGDKMKKRQYACSTLGFPRGEAGTKPGLRRATFPPGEGIAPLQIRKKEIPP